MEHKFKNFSLFIVLLVAFLDWMGIGLVYPMFSSMLFNNEVHLLPPDASETLRGVWLGILLSAMPVAQFISSPILGALSDQKGRKPVLKYSLLACAAGYLISAWGVYQQSLLLILLGRIAVGLGAGTASVVSAVLADLSKPEEKAKNFGLLNMAFGVGFIVGPFLGGMLSDTGYWRWGSYDKPFLFASLMTLLNLLLLVYFYKETHQPLKAKKINWVLGVINLKKAINLPGLRALFLATFLFGTGWSFYWEFIPVTWIKEYGLRAPEIGSLYGFAAGIYALSCGLLIRPIVSRFAPPKVLFFSLALSGLYIYLMLLHMPLNVLWFYIPLQQFLISMAFPTASAAVSNQVGEDAQGETMGIFQSVSSAAFALSPLLSGVFVGLSIDAPIIVGGSALLLSAVVVALAYPKVIFRKQT